MTAVAEIKPGTEIGYLRVMNQGDSNERGAARFWCECRAPGCGKRVLVMGRKLRIGQRPGAHRGRSCGCCRDVPPDPWFIYHMVPLGFVVPCLDPERPCPWCLDGSPRCDGAGNLKGGKAAAE